MAENNNYILLDDNFISKKYLLSDFSTDILPRGDKVLFRKLELDQKSLAKKSILVVPTADNAETKYVFGVIVAVGTNVKEYKVGEFIVSSKWSGIDFNVHGNKYYLVKSEDISATLNLVEKK